MKNLFSLFLCGLFVVSVFFIPASAAEPEDILISHTVEILDNNDYIITEVYESAIQPRSSKTGYGVAEYYNANGTLMWNVVVTGTFTYNGVTSYATSSSVAVNAFSNKVTFISKSANYSGNTATGTGTVQYNLVQTTLTARVSCDKNGNLY